MAPGKNEINSNPGQPTGVPVSVEIEEATELLSDAVKLAALEARSALAGVGTALVLMLAAAVSAVIALVIGIVTVAFTLNAAGLVWPLALLLTALIALLGCYLAVANAGRLLRRLTLPQTRQAFSSDSQTTDLNPGVR